MSAPLARSVIALAKDYTTRVSRMQASEPSFYEPLELATRLAGLGFARPPEQPSTATLVFPKRPTRQEEAVWRETAWWLAPIQPQGEGAEPVVPLHEGEGPLATAL